MENTGRTSHPAGERGHGHRARAGRRLAGLVLATAGVAAGGWWATVTVAGSALSPLAQSGLLLLLGCLLLVAVVLLPLLLVEAALGWRTDRLLAAVADHDDEAPWLAAIYRHLERAQP